MQRIQKYQMVCEKVQSYSISSKRVREPSTVHEALLALGAGRLITEHFWVVCLATSGDIVGIHDISAGSVDASIVSPKEVFTAVLNTPRTGAFIVAHNHPSENLVPSQDDKDVTEKLLKGSEILGVKMLDHVIISDEDYFSFKNNCLML